MERATAAQYVRSTTAVTALNRRHFRMPSNVIELRKGSRRRVLIAHQRDNVRRALRTLIEHEHTAVVEAADGEAALAELELARFDLLVLELDLPLKDGIAVMQLHRMLLAHEHLCIEPPPVILTLPPEVRGNATLTDHLRTLGVAAFIDDSPQPGVAALIDGIVRAHVAHRDAVKPAVA
jgi:CheY-like chemotaxis protein